MRAIAAAAVVALALVALPLSGVDRVADLDVDALSHNEVVVTVPDGTLDDGGCIDSLEIARLGSRDTVLWRIERQKTARAACPSRFDFPKIPEGYSAVTTAERLPQGRFVVSGMAADLPMAGHFGLR